MAKEVVYSIGQYRTQEVSSDSENIYSPKCDIALDYFDTPISNDSSAYTTTKGYSFRDPYIKLITNRYKTEAPGLQEESVAVGSNNGRVYSKNMVYYIRIAIPRNRIYDCDYNLKLYDHNRTEYQLIKNFSISKNLSESSQFTHDVVLFQPYPSDDTNHTGYADNINTYNDGRAENNSPLLLGRIPFYAGAVSTNWEFAVNSTILQNSDETPKYPTGGIFADAANGIKAADYPEELVYVTKVLKAQNDVIKNDESYTGTDRLFFYSDGKKWIQVTNYSYANLETTWNTESIDPEKVIIEAVFSPKGDNFDQLVIEMVRNVEDYNISYTVKDESSGIITKYYGRKLELKAADCELRTITDVINTLLGIKTTVIDANGQSSTSNSASVSRVGVWGRSDAITAIESEEFRIGPNGYYEIHIDGGNYNIERLGFVVRDVYDKFMMDYEYPRNISYAED